jgi:hypothetical protein
MRREKNEPKITLSQWHELSFEAKEKLKEWAIRHGFELDLTPGSSGSFDPSCEYAALLNTKQMGAFLHEHNKKVVEKADSNALWKSIVLLLN